MIKGRGREANEGKKGGRGEKEGSKGGEGERGMGVNAGNGRWGRT